MKPSVLAQLLGNFGWLSLISIGGANVLIPEIHRRVVDGLAWMDDPTFAQLFAISQAAPGPNIMFASVIGWHVAGLAGLMVATVAILLPSSLIAFTAGRAMARWQDRGWLKILKAGLMPIALGLILASGFVAAGAAGKHALAYGVTAAAAAFVFFTDRNPLLPMLFGTALFIVAGHFGLVQR